MFFLCFYFVFVLFCVLKFDFMLFCFFGFFVFRTNLPVYGYRSRRYTPDGCSAGHVFGEAACQTSHPEWPSGENRTRSCGSLGYSQSGRSPAPCEQSGDSFDTVPRRTCHYRIWPRSHTWLSFGLTAGIKAEMENIYQ